MSDHLRDQWRKIAGRGPDKPQFVILPKDPDEAYSFLVDHLKRYGHLSADASLSTEAAGVGTPKSLRDRLYSRGGFTVHPHKSAPGSGYMVSLAGQERVYSLKALNKKPQAMQHYYNEHKDLIDSHPDHYFGAWVHKGNVYLDVSRHHRDEAEAHGTARKNDQLAIYHLDSGTSIPTEGGTRTSTRAYGRNPIAFADQVQAMVAEAIASGEHDQYDEPGRDDHLL